MELQLIETPDHTYRIVIKDHSRTIIDINVGKNGFVITRTVNAFLHQYRGMYFNKKQIEETCRYLVKEMVIKARNDNPTATIPELAKILNFDLTGEQIEEWLKDSENETKANIPE